MKPVLSTLSILFFLLFFSTTHAQDVVIQEVLYNPNPGFSKKIALKNVSGMTLDVSNWCLCNVPAYRTIDNTTSFNILLGDPVNFADGDVLIIELTEVGFNLDSNSEIALYNHGGCSGFTTPANMEDFVIWGTSPGSSRQTVANNASLWNTGDIVPPGGQGEILRFDGSNGGGGNLTLSSDFSNDPNGLLPVELINFTAKLEEDRVELEWTTETETNSEAFFLERSLDGLQFDRIAVFEAAGFSNERQFYNYSDFELYPGRAVYYRLKQIDFDGQLTCSSVQVVGSTNAPFLPTVIYPNPVASSECFTMRLASDIDFEEITVVILNSSGSRVDLKAFDNLGFTGNYLFMDMPKVVPGLYFISLYHKNEYLESIKLVVH